MSWWGRFWVRRRETTVSEGLATFVAVIALLIGVGLGMSIVTGGDAPFACLEKGNAADWVAAVGTWVIGSGAWKYAREAHRLRIYEVSSDKIDRIEQRQFALNNIYSRLEITNFCMKLHADDANEDGTAIHANKLLATIRTNVAEINRLAWDEPADLILGADIKDGLMALRISRESYFAACKDAEEAFQNRARELVSPEEVEIEELLEFAEIVANETEDLMAQLATVLAECEHDIAALRRGALIQ